MPLANETTKAGYGGLVSAAAALDASVPRVNEVDLKGLDRRKELLNEKHEHWVDPHPGEKKITAGIAFHHKLSLPRYFTMINIPRSWPHDRGARPHRDSIW